MKKVNLIIPAYNEAERIVITLKELGKFLKSDLAKTEKYDYRLYVVNDGSTDNTATVVKELIQKYSLAGEILNCQQNQGKGGATKHGMLNSREADYYYQADADSSASWDELAKMLGIIEKEKIDAVIGSRALASSVVKTSAHKKLLGRIAAGFVKLILGLDYKDTQCGYKLFSKKCLPAFEKQTVMGFGYDFEILYYLEQTNLKVLEVGVKWEIKHDGTVRISSYFKTLWDLLKLRI